MIQQQTYFQNRGITIETLNRNGVKQQRKGENVSEAHFTVRPCCAMFV
jgi:hypothetical protein